MTPSQIIPLGEHEDDRQPLLLPKSKVLMTRYHSIRSPPSSMARSCFKYLVSSAVVILLIVAIVFLYFQTQIIPENYLGFHDSESKLGIYDHAAVTTDTEQCSTIGKEILMKGGSAVDAAIASLNCMAVVIPESLGLGGGCFITYYDAKERKSYAINARETAPSYAEDGMFEYANESARGPLAVAIPGEIIGYEVAHKKWGKLPWSELFTDAIKLAENGFAVSEHLATAIRQQENWIRSDQFKLKHVFMTEGKLLIQNDILKRPDLAKTMRMIARDGAKALYGGQVGLDLIHDFKEQGGKLELSELSSYKPREEEPFVMNLPNNLTLHSVNFPASGPLLGLILNVMLRYTDLAGGKTVIKSIKFFHRFAETLKFTYANRQLVGDPIFESGIAELVSNFSSDSFSLRVMDKIDDSKTQNDAKYYFDGPSLKLTREDHGTAAMSVIDYDGNAISVGSTVNAYFGSKIISPKTGIILNNEMDDFSNPNITNEFDLPPSDHNRIKPGKIPLSSMCPTIITNSTDGKVLLTIGGSGGTQITSSIALVILRSLFFDENIKRAIDAPRIHHQLLPMKLRHENNFNPIILQELRKKGHTTEPITGRGSIVMAIKRRKKDGKLEANSDFRKGGNVDGY